MATCRSMAASSGSKTASAAHPTVVMPHKMKTPTKSNSFMRATTSSTSSSSSCMAVELTEDSERRRSVRRPLANSAVEAVEEAKEAAVVEA